ncbi:hypothetical protein Slala03_55260 [Streptomyces lavendulae subsp. lavendulae]|nr:hypothetical protein Slala03_55260 [Streptomyces lavendulae subsp. lavendulae]
MLLHVPPAAVEARTRGRDRTVPVRIVREHHASRSYVEGFAAVHLISGFGAVGAQEASPAHRTPVLLGGLRSATLQPLAHQHRACPDGQQPTGREACHADSE